MKNKNFFSDYQMMINLIFRQNLSRHSFASFRRRITSGTTIENNDIYNKYDGNKDNYRNSNKDNDNESDDIRNVPLKPMRKLNKSYDPVLCLFILSFFGTIHL